MFAAVMVAILLLTFNVIGPFFQDLLQLGVDAAAEAVEGALDDAGAGEVITSLIVEGVFDGVGTVLLTPFMSCATKLVIYGFVAQAVFPRAAGWVMAALYLLGIVVAVALGFALRHTAFKGEAVPFVMELPNYRRPTARNVARLVWDKSRDFVVRAFTVILVATMVVWFLRSFSLQLELVADPADSILVALASWMAPAFAPLGFGDWRFVTALVTGFLAKEKVVSTLVLLFGTAEAIAAALAPAAAVSFLVFCLLYTPCVAAVAAIRRELGTRMALVVVVGQCVIAWALAFCAYHLLAAFGL